MVDARECAGGKRRGGREGCVYVTSGCDGVPCVRVVWYWWYEVVWQLYN